MATRSANGWLRSRCSRPEPRRGFFHHRICRTNYDESKLSKCDSPCGVGTTTITAGLLGAASCIAPSRVNAFTAGIPQHPLHNGPLVSCRNFLGKLINQEVSIRTLTTLMRNRNYCAFRLGHEIKACRVHWQSVSRPFKHIPRHECVFFPLFFYEGYSTHS